MSRQIFARFLVSIFFASLLSLTAACNTVEGAGEDVEAAGEAIQDGAQDTKDAID
ncbi:entericidin A/B family lipoprotein [Algihabitans albus]|uniref:entericidin A/B family lipoprotein n=1 Tax=Algihabitans albus TaxID=2164067 RepID=UPI000E5C7D86|nr:entericidin A/B family lipoprotein [Algihabitans albus]